MAAAGYDPREFQTLAAATETAAARTRATPIPRPRPPRTPPGKAAADDSHCCYHCGTTGAKFCCGGCHCAWVSGRACFKASGWGHKKACLAAKRAEVQRVAWRASASAARHNHKGGKGGKGGGGGGGGGAGGGASEPEVCCRGVRDLHRARGGTGGAAVHLCHHQPPGALRAVSTRVT